MYNIKKFIGGYVLRHASTWDISKTIPSLHTESMVTDTITVDTYIYRAITGYFILILQQVKR